MRRTNEDHGSSSVLVIGDVRNTDDDDDRDNIDETSDRGSSSSVLVIGDVRNTDDDAIEDERSMIIIVCGRRHR